jgi:hypothetical protein
MVVLCIPATTPRLARDGMLDSRFSVFVGVCRLSSLVCRRTKITNEAPSSPLKAEGMKITEQQHSQYNRT